GKGQICLWMDAERNILVKSCNLCRKDKVTCPGKPGTVKVPKGKKRQCTLRSLSPKAKGKRRQRSPSPEPSEVMEYDNQAWVAAASNIVAELAQTNSLLERSILAAEGSRAAADLMCSGLELFLQQQREFQVLLFGELRMGVQMSLEEVWKSSDVEEEDEEMSKESRSEEEGSREADEFMEILFSLSCCLFRYLYFLHTSCTSELNWTGFIRICRVEV
ncbi:hypothetical protein P692DRAFT_20717101, partial [Suillus brevipes Sb2]